MKQGAIFVLACFFTSATLIRMEASRIFLFTIGAFLGGVFIRSFADISSNLLWFLVFVGLCIIGVGLSKRQRKLYLYGVFLLAFCLGIFRFTASITVPADVTRLYGQEISMRGVVFGEPDIRGVSQQLTIRVTDDANGALGEPFLILARTRAYPHYQIGDGIAIHGTLEKPSRDGTFDYAAYLAKDGIYVLMRYPELQQTENSKALPFLLSTRRTLFQIRHAFSERLNLIISEPHAAFLSGLLIGERREIPLELLSALQKTGTTHIIALSGFNISIIADSLLGMLQWLAIPFPVSFWIAVFFVIAFTIMTGASASLVRAAIMGILILVARRRGRVYDARLALVAAAGGMVLQEPGILRFDLGFQLSFLATVGMIFITPKIHEKLKRYIGEVAAKVTASTLGAQLAVMPLLMYAFGTVSIISPIANLLILAIIPITMLIGFGAVLIGFLWIPAGVIAGLGAWIMLSYEIAVITWLARVPFANVEISVLTAVPFGIIYLYLLKKVLK